MTGLNFEQLIEKYGEAVSWHVLAEIEKASKLQPQHAGVNPEARLAYALCLQDQQALFIA